MNTKVLRAVFCRNFVGYFANPTGYVFICVFVLLSSIAAFLPDEFFNINLANLDQLNLWFPLIMLVFVPAVTMGIWADEKRQGTDELLLTIPATDFDIVMGKFLAAIGILSVSLLFSFFSNLIILSQLGQPDIGLFISTYIGFFLIGLMMVAIGMVASFITGNLTVAYILGALFNAPLVAIQWAYILPLGRNEVSFLQTFSIQEQFSSFGRGIVSFSGIVYFLSIMGVMLYISMVLISKRHWSANQAFNGWAHYLTRGAALLVIAISLSCIFQRFDLRSDMTEDKLSSLSKETIKLLQEINPKHPVTIEAFISDEVPKEYAETRLNTLSMLREIQSRAQGRVFVRIHPMKPNTKEAVLAEQRFGIVPKMVISLSQGIGKREPVFMGIVMRSGLNTVKLPFIEKGLAPEYELVRALSSVTAQSKKRIGILKTDAKLMGDYDFMNMRPPMPWSVIEELRQQYIVTEVDPALPILETFDVLLAVQPSSLAPNDMENFIQCVRAGQPTLIFEDPIPISDPSLPGTADPKTSGPMGGMTLYQQPIPKGNIEPLWELLAVDFNALRIPRSSHNPFPRLQTLPQEVLFIDYDRKKDTTKESIPFNLRDPITNRLQNIVMLFAGSVDVREGSTLTHTNLIWTTRADGYVLRTELFPGGRMMRPDPNPPIYKDDNQHNMAVRIEGEIVPKTPLLDPAGKPLAQEHEPVAIKVILVSDVDMIAENFYQLRQQGASASMGAFLDFDNITFLLNAIDSLAGEERFIPIRSRRPAHKTLTKFDEMVNAYRKAANEQQAEAQQHFEQMQKKVQTEMMAEIEKLSRQIESDTRLTTQEIFAKIQAISTTKQKQVETMTAGFQRNMEEKNTAATVKMNEQIRTIQGRVKTLAILIPPLPLLIIAIIVFILRRMRETEGVAQTRLRKKR